MEGVITKYANVYSFDDLSHYSINIINACEGVHATHLIFESHIQPLRINPIVFRDIPAITCLPHKYILLHRSSLSPDAMLTASFYHFIPYPDTHFSNISSLIPSPWPDPTSSCTSNDKFSFLSTQSDSTIDHRYESSVDTGHPGVTGRTSVWLHSIRDQLPISPYSCSYGTRRHVARYHREGVFMHLIKRDNICRLQIMPICSRWT